MHLRQIKNKEEVEGGTGTEGKEEQPLAPDTLRIRGTADDEASMSGKMTLYFHLPTSAPRSTRGSMRDDCTDCRAFGGHWGIQGHETNHAEAGGRFFFYKI